MDTQNKPRITALIAVAGTGSRMKCDTPKQFLEIGGIPVLARTLSVFQKCDFVDEIVIVTRLEDIDRVKELTNIYNITKVADVISGGDTRQASVYNGICASCGEYILIHDGARPFITAKQISRLAQAVTEYNAVALGIPVTDTLKKVDDCNLISKTVNRESLYSIQTPQCFKLKLIKEAHQKAIKDNISVTDDCALAELFGISIKVLDGSSLNIKITTPDDLILAEGILSVIKEEL